MDFRGKIRLNSLGLTMLLEPSRWSMTCVIFKPFRAEVITRRVSWTKNHSDAHAHVHGRPSQHSTLGSMFLALIPMLAFLNYYRDTNLFPLMKNLNFLSRSFLTPIL